MNKQEQTGTDYKASIFYLLCCFDDNSPILRRVWRLLVRAYQTGTTKAGDNF